MRPKSFAGTRCSITGALNLVGDRWTLLLIRDLSLGLSRFDELCGEVGIPTATLTARLKHMIDHGLVARVRYQDRPPRDEYRLTAKGRDLSKVILALREWGDRWDATGLGAPAIQTIDDKTGHALSLALVDSETGRVVPSECARLLALEGADDDVRTLVDRFNANAVR